MPFGVVAAIVEAATAVGVAVSGTIAGGAAALGASTAAGSALFGAGSLAAEIGSAGLGALTGAGIGAAGSAITGGDPLTGALLGGFTGGLGGAGIGAALGGTLGIGAGGGNALLGAGMGALGGAATGGDPLKGALMGGLTGYASGALSGFDSPFGDPGAGSFGSMYGASDQTLAQQMSSATPIGSAGSPSTIGAPEVAGASLSSGAPGTESGVTSALNPQSAASAKPDTSSSDGILSKLAKNPSLLMGALSALQSMSSKPKQGGYALPGPGSVNLGSNWNRPLTTAPGRTVTTPTVPSWYTYGQIPGGAIFFGNNSLKAYGFAEGGALSRAAGYSDGEFRTSTHDRHVKGPGTETSDDVPAMLSRNEYVLDAADVRAIGNGSNARGAHILDRERKRLDHGGGALSRLGRGR